MAGIGWWFAAERQQPEFQRATGRQRHRSGCPAPISPPPGSFVATKSALFREPAHPRGNAEFEAIAHLQVSAHFFCAAGGLLQQFCELRRPRLAGRRRAGTADTPANDHRIGIEIEGDAVQRFTAAQYAALDPLLAAIAARYPVRAVT